MNSRKLFIRKIVYVLAIAAMLYFLHGLGARATKPAKNSPGSPGGKLAQLRTDYHLSQAELGEIDPTGATMKLATLGLRGVAVNLLWEKANDYQKRKDFVNRRAVLTQITKLEPNFIQVWINQAWNLSYNISVQFDDYRERYRWVLKGFEFLQEGMRYNDRQPRLQYEMGWMVSQKIAKADEQKQYRRLLAADDDYRDSLPAKIRYPSDPRKTPFNASTGRLDNWLVGKRWYEEAMDMVAHGMPILGKGPLLAKAAGPMCQMYYAEYLEKDGTFGEVAKMAWQQADKEWHEYGNMPMPTTFKDEKDQTIWINLNDEEFHRQEIKKLAGRLEALQPGLRQKIVAEKRNALSDAQRKALDTPPEKRANQKDWELAAQAEQATQVTYDELARRVRGEKRKEATDLATQIADHDRTAHYIKLDRNVVNFEYWRLRAQIEQGDDMLAARRLLFEGDKKYHSTGILSARQDYDESFRSWRKVLDAHKELLDQQDTRDDLMEAIGRYREILRQLEKTTLPPDFILRDVIEADRKAKGMPSPEEKPKAEAPKAEKPKAEAPKIEKPKAATPAGK
jgi:hypothetical protein